ncbi:MAG TPA: winged helix-turn-helix domain-containing protein, partial [Tahibacter sp.]|nr:winged helix-turn-helix domain-containing protein [Tahibacter sp.]
MRDWNLAIGIDASREQPLFVQIAHALAEAIRDGRLKRGDALPGSRALAAALGVTRNTVVAGYDELVAEGLAETRSGAGTFVAASPPMRAVVHNAAQPTYALPPPPAPPPPVVATRPGMLRLDAAHDHQRVDRCRQTARLREHRRDLRAQAALSARVGVDRKAAAAAFERTPERAREHARRKQPRVGYAGIEPQ